MRKATREESIKTIKIMLKRRYKERMGGEPTEMWLNERAEKVYAESEAAGDHVQVLEPAQARKDGEG